MLTSSLLIRNKLPVKGTVSNSSLYVIWFYGFIMIKVCACYHYFDLNTGMTKCTLRSRNNMDNIFCFRVTISFLQNVCAFRLVPMLFTTLVVFSWVDSSQVCFSKCSILSATLYMLVIRVYFIYMYRVFFPWTKKNCTLQSEFSPL